MSKDCKKEFFFFAMQIGADKNSYFFRSGELTEKLQFYVLSIICFEARLIGLY